jgi:hypothetical protein
MFHEAIRQHSVHQAAMIALGAGTPSSATVDHPYHCNASDAAKVSVSSSDASDCCGTTQNPCLPRNTIVLISGNNRTRRSLIGQHAVIRRSVGLGGWHHVVSQGASVQNVSVVCPSEAWALTGHPWHVLLLVRRFRCCKMGQRSSSRLVLTPSGIMSSSSSRAGHALMYP